MIGQIIERVTGQPLPHAVRRLADYSRAGLTDTYLELLEPAPSSAPRATQYVGDQDLTHGASPTIDLYGSGGQVSSMRDIAHFYRFPWNQMLINDLEPFHEARAWVVRQLA